MWVYYGSIFITKPKYILLAGVRTALITIVSGGSTALNLLVPVNQQQHFRFEHVVFHAVLPFENLAKTYSPLIRMR